MGRVGATHTSSMQGIYLPVLAISVFEATDTHFLADTEKKRKCLGRF